MSNKKFFIIFITCVGLYIFYIKGKTFVPAEQLTIPSSVGYDLAYKNGTTPEYSIPIAVYNFSGEKPTPIIIQTGIGKTLGQSRQNRQLKLDLKFILGLEKILIFSEETANFGLENIIDILFSNPNVNDTAVSAVCKGKSEDILRLNMKGFSNPGDYLSDVIKNNREFNFFSDNYKLMDIYVRMDAEGRTLVLPYVEIKDQKPEITGVAIFKKDKLVKKLGIDEARILNMLIENDVRGIISIKTSFKEYIDFYAIAKRDITCKKENDKYTFYINLSLKGDMISNTLYKNIANNPVLMQKLKDDINKEVTTMCYNFINRMQKEYKIDCLSLGSIGAAKVGRHTGTDWDKVVSEANIIVNVNTQIDRMGRGDY
ncbi:Ger(x)C family spore germination protein [Clostridium sp. MB40-C1]|uniref:Ger(x)C family spore germination protein n=1 Tax=Clostridium sp. MB40-C1 TaxID=3070996 RepID=UPI0027E1695D|nr:Ger(x)C family spore germination protein [Clostridium sp. MB40-C1]WMJ80747.1 Ger(x)C family spore germination protein [Clostridium sp. MB40-C1]